MSKKTKKSKKSKKAEPLKVIEINNFKFSVFKTKSKYSHFYLTASVDDGDLYLRGINYLKNNGKPFLATPSFEVDDDYKSYFYFSSDVKEELEKELKKLLKKSKDADNEDDDDEDEDDDDDVPFTD